MSPAPEPLAAGLEEIFEKAQGIPGDGVIGRGQKILWSRRKILQRRVLFYLNQETSDGHTFLCDGAAGIYSHFAGSSCIIVQRTKSPHGKGRTPMKRIFLGAVCLAAAGGLLRSEYEKRHL